MELKATSFGSCNSFIFLRTMHESLLPFVELIKSGFNTSLPGVEAHKEMSPEHRRHLPDPLEHRPARHGAVLLLLYEKDGEIYFPLIQRPEYNGVHGGQVSLPGGKSEEGDPDLYHTALREAEEEIGIIPLRTHFIGALSSLYIWVSHFHVHPYVSWYDSSTAFKPDGYEVEEIIEVPLSFLFDPAIRKVFTYSRNNISIEAPCFDKNGRMIWGATAMILNEFYQLLSNLKVTPAESTFFNKNK